MLFVCSLDQPTERLYDGSRRNLHSIKDEMVRGLHRKHVQSPTRTGIAKRSVYFTSDRDALTHSTERI